MRNVAADRVIVWDRIWERYIHALQLQDRDLEREARIAMAAFDRRYGTKPIQGLRSVTTEPKI
jgi:hypothetical protein